MMCRYKTKIETEENAEEQAARLRGALFALSIIDDPEEMKRIARCAMAGELHGREIKPVRATET